MPSSDTPYIGRFAPSPTGALHFGSLLAALASYLDARHHQGTWLLRMEDLDPPREQPGAADRILATLDRFGLHWDGEVLYQSRQLPRYQALIEQLLDRGDAYRCDCSRQQIARRTDAAYDGHCVTRQASVGKPAAVRFRVATRSEAFEDAIQGPQKFALQRDADDYILFRRDGFFAYQLAVVADDAQQAITHIVRGCDLLDSTPRQIQLQRRLGFVTPRYAHIPVVVSDNGEKLSKRTFATALDERQPQHALFAALCFLGQQPPSTLRGADAAELLAWAIPHWRRTAVPTRQQMLEAASTERV